LRGVLMQELAERGDPLGCLGLDLGQARGGLLGVRGRLLGSGEFELFELYSARALTCTFTVGLTCQDTNRPVLVNGPEITIRTALQRRGITRRDTHGRTQ
jgi:hypothetical protein